MLLQFYYYDYEMYDRATRNRISPNAVDNSTIHMHVPLTDLYRYSTRTFYSEYFFRWLIRRA